MKNASNFKSIAAALLAGCVATAALVNPVHAEVPPPATGYTPFIPIIFPIFPIIKPMQSSCEIRASGATVSRLVSRDFHVFGYAGWSIDSAKLRYVAGTTGTYKYRLVVRHTNRSGDIITKSELKTLNLVAGTPVTSTALFGNSYIGNAFNLSISHEDVTGPGALYMDESPSGCSNTVTTASDGGAEAGLGDIGFEIRGDTTHAVTEVVEYRVLANNKYFITGRADEKALLDGMPANFARTGKKFRVPSKFNYGNVSDVYRFFAPAAVTHAFVDKADHDMIVAIPNTGLNDEGADFGTVLPDAAGTCPSWAPGKVYRSFRNSPIVTERNHRYTTSEADYNAMTFAGWTPEGVKMCAVGLN